MVCDCHTGWSGPKCNNKVYECSKTCHNGGTCEFKSDFSQVIKFTIFKFFTEILTRIIYF